MAPRYFSVRFISLTVVIGICYNDQPKRMWGFTIMYDIAGYYCTCAICPKEHKRLEVPLKSKIFTDNPFLIVLPSKRNDIFF